MPIYPFYCDCGFEIELKGSVRDVPVPPECPKCGNPTYRDYHKQGCAFSFGDSICRQSTGYADDHFDAEIYRMKTGQKHHLPYNYEDMFPKDKTTGRIIKKKKGRKKKNFY